MSSATDFSAHPSAFGVVTRMPKRERPAKHARIKVKLDTVMGVAREMGRLIRLSYNGHLAPEELTKYVFALDKLRGCLESAANIEATAKAAEADAAQATEAARAAQARRAPVIVNVLSVPQGCFLTHEQMRPKWQLDGVESEHCPPALAIEHCAEPVDPRTPDAPAPCEAQSTEEETRIIDNLKREINELARKVGVSVDV
jgi:hypothetical protein